MGVMERKRLLGPKLDVMVTRVRADIRGGLEGAMLSQLNPMAIDWAREIIRRWYKRDVTNPAGEVLAVVEKERIAAGSVEMVDAQRGALGRLFLGKTKHQPNCGQIATLSGAYDAMFARWMTFARNEWGFYQQLLATCTSAIASRQATSE